MEKSLDENSKTRLLQFLSHLGIGQGKFEKFTDISNGYINNSKGGIGSDILNKIIIKYPELNLYWVVTGQGQMLLSENVAAKKEIDYYKDKCLSLYEENRELRKEIDALKKSPNQPLIGTSDASDVKEEAV